MNEHRADCLSRDGSLEIVPKMRFSKLNSSPFPAFSYSARVAQTFPLSYETFHLLSSLANKCSRRHWHATIRRARPLTQICNYLLLCQEEDTLFLQQRKEIFNRIIRIINFRSPHTMLQFVSLNPILRTNRSFSRHSDNSFWQTKPPCSFCPQRNKKRKKNRLSGVKHFLS